MPPKKVASKRKGDETKPIVSDPFSASKRVKKTENILKDSDDQNDVIKKLDYESKGAELNSSKEIQKEQEISKEKLKYDSNIFRDASNGKEWNLKITSWNVSGVRACLEKSGLDYIKAEDADIVCLQELKCDKVKIPIQLEMKAYHCYWLAGSTKGYAGVGLMSKVKPISVTYELGEFIVL